MKKKEKHQSLVKEIRLMKSYESVSVSICIFLQEDVVRTSYQEDQDKNPSEGYLPGYLTSSNWS